MMNPRTSRHADLLLNNIYKRSDIMIGDSFTLTNCQNKLIVNFWRSLTTNLRMITWHNTEFAMCCSS